MDIDLLSKMVKELILDCDEVALPGIGTFVAELVPATFSDRGYTINPPYRRLFFRQRVGDERLLADFYLRTNGLQADSAEGKVAEQGLNDFLAEMKDLLLDKKTIAFPGLGRLRATRENNLFFIPDEDLDIYPAGYGLEPVSLKTHEETPEEVSAAVAGLATFMDEQSAAEIDVPAEEPVEADIPAEPAKTEVPVETIEEETPAIEPETQVAEEIPAVEPEMMTAEPEPPAITPDIPSVGTKTKAKKGKAWLWAAAGAVGVAAVLLLALTILGRVAPDFVDQFLYSADELRIINY